MNGEPRRAGFTQRLALVCARHPWWTIGVWLVAGRADLVLGGLGGPSIDGELVVLVGWSALALLALVIDERPRLRLASPRLLTRDPIGHPLAFTASLPALAQTQLRVFSGGQNQRPDLMRKLFDQYQKANPGVSINIETGGGTSAVSYTHLRAHETPEHLVCRVLLAKKQFSKNTHNDTNRYNVIYLTTEIIQQTLETNLE